MLTTFTKTVTEIRDQKTGATLDRVEGYHGPAEVVIKRLGWRRLEEAAEDLMRDGIRTVREMGGAEAMRELQTLTQAAKKPGDDAKPDVDVARELVAEAKKANPLAAYNPRTLCLAGLVTIDGVEKTPEMVEDFEPEVLTGIARTILYLARPGLFETEEARKNA